MEPVNETETLNATAYNNANSSKYSTTSLVLVILAPTLTVLLQLVTATMKESNKKGLEHCRRRIQHALTGLLFYTLSFILTHFVASMLLSSTTMLFYVLHSSRSRSKYIQQCYMAHFGPLLREHEKNVHTPPGAFWFLFGTTLLILLFPIEIARASLLCLSFGDPLAAIVGTIIGGPTIHLKHGRKTLVGCGVCFITCVLISIFCFGRKYGWFIWILTGFYATTMEVSSGYTGIDDNILIPLGTGLGLWIYVNTYCTLT
mmetsp:Transcript_2274/g.2724  ORF Transcript_2274/g.2724 Transcript_2274/m.2724 type:complete len:259 (-) Transcript_2274:134-910(-)